MSASDPNGHAMPLASPCLQWEVFCHVIDNLGDIGVCWRLCTNLAERGQRVRLWIDQPEPLKWMAPGAIEGAVPGIQVQPYLGVSASTLCHAAQSCAQSDVWVDTFGSDPPEPCQQQLATTLAQGLRAPPVWVNLEYLSAQSYIERSHGLPSLVNQGPLRGLTRWYYYPSFSTRGGGLLREHSLMAQQNALKANTPDLVQTAVPPTPQPSYRVSLFCYEPSALPTLLHQASAPDQAPIDWLVTPGRAWEAVQRALHDTPSSRLNGTITALEHLSQTQFDRLLWSCDLNFVRGEDSLVRAIWAGQPLVWHIYPQHDLAHHSKLEAFLDWLQAPASMREFHRSWNGLSTSPRIWPGWQIVQSWQSCIVSARERLLAQPDLGSQLIKFVNSKR